MHKIVRLIKKKLNFQNNLSFFFDKYLGKVKWRNKPVSVLNKRVHKNINYYISKKVVRMPFFFEKKFGKSRIIYFLLLRFCNNYNNIKLR